MITMNLYGVPVHNCERDLLDFVCTGRYYYRIRGKRVLPVQAFDIIRRTDSFLRDIDQIYWRDEFVGGELFPSYFFTRRRTPAGFSWAHLDGTVGLNHYLALPFVSMKDILREWSGIAKAFPFLDLVIAITNWDEFSYEAWAREEQAFNYKADSFYEIDGRSYDEVFYEDVKVGLHVCNGEIELLDKETAVKKYKEYAEKYEGKLREKYQANYYQEVTTVHRSPEMLIQAIEEYGLDPAEVTSLGRPLTFLGGE